MGEVITDGEKKQNNKIGFFQWEFLCKVSYQHTKNSVSNKRTNIY